MTPSALAQLVRLRPPVFCAIFKVFFTLIFIIAQHLFSSNVVLDMLATRLIALVVDLISFQTDSRIDHLPFRLSEIIGYLEVVLACRAKVDLKVAWE